MFRQRRGTNHTDYAFSLNKLGLILFDRREFAQAERIFRKVLAIEEKQFGPSEWRVGNHHLNLGLTLLAKGDLAGAEAAARRDLAIQEKAGRKVHPDVIMPIGLLSAVLRRGEGQVAGGEAMFQKARMMANGIFPSGHPMVALWLDKTGIALESSGDESSAEALLGEVSLKLENFQRNRRRILSAGPFTVAEFFSKRKRFAEAEALLLEGYGRLSKREAGSGAGTLLY